MSGSLIQPPRVLAQEKAAQREGSGDEMIISAGDFLVHALRPAARRQAWERSALCGLGFAAIGELVLPLQYIPSPLSKA